MSEPVYPKYRWVVIASLCAVQAVTVAVLVAPATLIEGMRASLGLKLGMTTFVAMNFHNIFAAISAIFGGAVIDRFGPYRVWTGGMALFVIGLLMVPVFGENLYMILTIRALHGIGFGPIIATAPLVVAQWSPPHQRSVIIGIQGISAPIGAAVSMLYVPFVFEKTGNWQLALTATGVFALAALILALAISRGPKPPAGSTTDDIKARGDSSLPKLKTARIFYLMPATWAAALCAFWFSWAIRTVYDIIPNYLASQPPDGIGMGQEKAGFVMAVVHILSIIGLLASGFLVELFFRGRPKKLIIIGFFLGALALLPMGFPKVFSSHVIISLSLWTGGAAVSLTFPLVLTFVSKYYPEKVMGEIGGLITGSSTLGTLLGLTVGSFVLDFKPVYHMTIMMIIAGAFLGFVSALFLKETYRDKQTRPLFIETP